MRPSRPPLPPPEPPRESKFGELTLIERIAVGGMAEVFRAREPRAVGEARTIVVKRMLPHIASEPGAARMFDAEAELGRQITHPNVVAVLGAGEHDGTPYLRLELVPGVDLARLRRGLDDPSRALPVEIAVHIVRELLAGLHAVHEANDDRGPLAAVHGDVSPSNILLSVQGDVKLADFGIAQARLRSAFPQAAAAGRTRGKLAYLAPEQVRGEPIDRRADLFAASAVLAELLIGTPIFARASELATLLAIRDAHVQPSLAAARLPAGLDAVLLRGLARDPHERFPTSAALRDALAPFAREPDTVLRARVAALVRAACGHIDPAAQPAGPDDITIEPPLSEYWVRTRAGREFGPWSFAQLVETITVGGLEPEDEMRSGRSSWRRLADIEELAPHLPRARIQASRRTEPPPVRGVELARGGIVEALARAANERASGVWVCSAGETRKEIYLVEGTPEFVTSNVPSELLGEFLVARKVLTRGELDMALAVLPRFDGRLGDTLSALGLMEPTHVFRHIAEQVREKILSLFTWTDGRAEFSPGVAPPQRGFPLGLDPWRILLEGIERRLAEGLEHDTFALHMTDDLVPVGRSAPHGLPPEVEQLMLIVRRARPLQEVVRALEDPSDRDVHRPYRAVRLGLALELVAWSSA